jgi:hypothetical protein
MCKIPKKSITPLSTFSGDFGKEFSNSQGILARSHTCAKHTKNMQIYSFSRNFLHNYARAKLTSICKRDMGHEKRN